MDKTIKLSNWKVVGDDDFPITGKFGDGELNFREQKLLKMYLVFSDEEEHRT